MILTEVGIFEDEKEYNKERERWIKFKPSSLQRIVWVIWPTLFSKKLSAWKLTTKLKEKDQRDIEMEEKKWK